MNANIFEENDNESQIKSTARCLSKVATEEILGNKLYLLFALGKNGEIVRFYPYGTDLEVKDLQHKKLQNSDECGDDIVCLEISVQLPKCDLNLPECESEIDLPLDCDEQLLALRTTRRRSCCKLGGTEQPC